MADDKQGAMQIVQMPDGKQVSFPTDMPDKEISMHVQRYIGNTGAASPITPPGVPRPSTGMHKSYLVGNENEDPDTYDPYKAAGDAVAGAAQGAYSASTPNIAVQMLKKARGNPADPPDFESPINNAVMMGGMGIAEGVETSGAERAALPATTADAVGAEMRSPVPTGARASGSAAGAAPNAIDLLKAGSKLIPGVGKATHLAEFGRTALDMLRKRGGNGVADASGPSVDSTAAESVGRTLAPRESTAVPQTFPPTAGYPVTGRPVASTQEWQGANSPAKSVEETPDMSSTQPMTTSVKPILAKATANNGPGAHSDIPGANGNVSSTIGKLIKQAPSVIDDAVAAVNRSQASTQAPANPAKKLVRTKPATTTTTPAPTAEGDATRSFAIRKLKKVGK